MRKQILKKLLVKIDKKNTSPWSFLCHLVLYVPLWILFPSLVCCILSLFPLPRNAKDIAEEADTVGCCSLRVEHLHFHKEQRTITFDFIGKDSIRYHKDVQVDDQVYQNLQSFCNGKQPDQKVLDQFEVCLVYVSELLVCQCWLLCPSVCLYFFVLPVLSFSFFHRAPSWFSRLVATHVIESLRWYCALRSHTFCPFLCCFFCFSLSLCSSTSKGSSKMIRREGENMRRRRRSFLFSFTFSVLRFFLSFCFFDAASCYFLSSMQEKRREEKTAVQHKINFQASKWSSLSHSFVRFLSFCFIVCYLLLFFLSWFSSLRLSTAI